MKLNHTLIAIAIGLLLGLAWQLYGNPHIRALRRAGLASMNGHGLDNVEDIVDVAP